MAHHFYRAALLGLTVLAAAPRSQAQNADHKTAISLYGTTLQYRGDLGTQFWNTQDSPFGGGITLSRYISKGFDLNLSANYTKLRYPTGTGYTGGNNSGTRFDAKLLSYGLGFKFKLPIKDEFFVHPYILVQPGFTWVNSDYVNGARPTVISNHTYGAFDAQGALGLDFRLSPGASLFLQAGQHFIITPDDARLDGVSSNSVTILNKYDRYLQFSAGLTFNLGKAKDTDGDGVADRKDKCPDTPAGVKVDATGCPLDTDGDGVADYQDKCPDVKGLAALQGCPDADGDGVADADDKCPNTPAGVKVDATGCPVDTDGDKVPDYLDKCPNTPAGVKVDATGCPVDTDGDGVPDYQDKCPDRAGPASNQGCPEMKAEDKKVLNEATKYIQFAYNKATLLPVSYKRLDQIVSVLNNYPDYSLGMSGHTDDVGNEAFNLRLSYDRAEAVRAYLIAKGIVATRIEARGYGKLKPIASNKTKAGQALNRRVEMDPYLTGEANPAEAKYGPAPTVAELKAKGKTAPKGAAPARKKAPAKKAPAKKAATRK
ncbi:OmpA family protein [Hymenobacter caeli]|uniref:Outer membrane protein OmpA-like peptidoglycan-associated protein n=1 Tax=Hymenobacter caeli TaxID=2735894 RepID=A0ABX2FVM5_9BACT|nr:OmpA family protein [Hymenobacter caeli]NRT20477.1 outer membrane protein OmpA-like peptidoglycan-associated protein [Hymenobacter caeli]